MPIHRNLTCDSGHERFVAPSAKESDINNSIDFVTKSIDTIGDRKMPSVENPKKEIDKRMNQLNQTSRMVCDHETFAWNGASGRHSSHAHGNRWTCEQFDSDPSEGGAERWEVGCSKGGNGVQPVPNFTIANYLLCRQQSPQHQI